MPLLPLSSCLGSLEMTHDASRLRLEIKYWNDAHMEKEVFPLVLKHFFGGNKMAVEMTSEIRIVNSALVV